MSSSVTNNQEATNNTRSDDAVAYQLQEMARFSLSVETNTSASFTNRPIDFIVPVSIQLVVVTSEHVASTRVRDSDIDSGINDLVSEASPVNEPIHMYTRPHKRQKSFIEVYSAFKLT
ncbi:Hypothetical predicted protein [Octopus vulgaris]|uniref:Uncharacterized protein n=1 Tax=Octopus vulgaris TaxID=6645 RepID=A0AA36B9K4_OCTVU|nr:Hypothetical predicted protein [Octopus vulgaris]